MSLAYHTWISKHYQVLSNVNIRHLFCSHFFLVRVFIQTTFNSWHLIIRMFAIEKKQFSAISLFKQWLAAKHRVLTTFCGWYRFKSYFSIAITQKNFFFHINFSNYLVGLHRNNFWHEKNFLISCKELISHL